MTPVYAVVCTRFGGESRSWDILDGIAFLAARESETGKQGD
jgi:hypothetical protein